MELMWIYDGISPMGAGGRLPAVGVFLATALLVVSVVTARNLARSAGA